MGGDGTGLPGQAAVRLVPRAETGARPGPTLGALRGGQLVLRAAQLPPGGPQTHRCHHQQAHDRSEEHTSELQSLMRISYAVFCLKKKKITTQKNKDNRYLKKNQP